MAVKASSNITLFHVIGIDIMTIYYLLQSSTANPPSKSTTDNPGGNWLTTEPTYVEGNTHTLYIVAKIKIFLGLNILLFLNLYIMKQKKVHIIKLLMHKQQLIQLIMNIVKIIMFC
jgi:hypothetical protein